MPAAEPALPTLPERFTNVAWLGQGGQALTLAAHDEHRGHDVAIKVLELALVRDWKAFERFERECTVLASLDHPGVPTYLEQIRDDERGRYLLVMERVPGRTLAEDLACGRRRTEAQLLDILEQLLAVLEYLHGLHPPVIHRDIKPGNVVLRPDGRVVLVDFGGVAKVFRPEGASTVIGTFGYMAPEQLYGRATPASDLYALGATLAAVASGEDAERLPRRGLEVDLSQAIHPGRLQRVLAALLRADPDHRPGSVAEVRSQLRHDDGATQVPAPIAGRSDAAVASPGDHTGATWVPAQWRSLDGRQKLVALAYLWLAIGLGVATRAVLLSTALLLSFPLVLGLIAGRRRRG